jgi:hypothetical protein
VDNVIARIHQVLASRGLTLFDVSHESRLRYRDNIAYRIPHHFYADMRTKDFSPRMEQVLAFSAITNYRLVDWLAVFGFRLDDAPRLAAALPTERTVLLDTGVYDDEVWIEWFRNKSFSSSPPPIAPLGQMLESGIFRQLKSLLPGKPAPFLYAKVGRRDAFAFPDLLPGSIVRVHTRRESKRSGIGIAAASKLLFLVEHSKGLTCCRLHVPRKNCVTLRSTQLPYAEVELQLGREAHVLGVLDLEFRFLANAPSPEVPRDLAAFWNPQDLPSPPEKRALSQLVIRGRNRAGFSLREASALSRRIAETLGDRRYFCARGTLAGYETTDTPPRHIHKILALCVLYSLGFWEVLGAAGLKTDGLGREPIPSDLVGRQSGPFRNMQAQMGTDFGAGGFLSSLVEEFEEIPFFLRNSLGALSGLQALSLRDVVWLGGHHPSLHPYVAGAVFATINRRHKKPLSAEKRPLWEQPLYILLQRDGSYLCTRCMLHNDVLVVHPYADGFERPVRLRNRVDVEVVGKVVALLRRL